MLSEQPVSSRASSRLRTSRLLTVALLAVPLILSACAKDAPQDGFTSPEGPVAEKKNEIVKIAFIIGYLVVLPFVYGLVMWCAVKFRRKGDDDVPKQVHGNKVVEIASVGVASAVLIGLGIPATAAYFDVTEDKDNCFEVTVIGHQWWWEYRYPAEGTKLATTFPRNLADPADVEEAEEEGREAKRIYGIPKDDGPVIVNANELHIPEGCNVRLNITSMDVLHNYWVPKLSGKIYAIPGKFNKLNIEANTGLAKPGKPHFIYGQCAEFCGTSHANMRFKVVVHTEADFQAWLDGQKQPARKATTELEKKGEELFAGGAACASCHYLDPTKGWDPTVDVAKIGPNLAHIGSRKHFAGAIGELNDKELTAWLRNPQEYKPGSLMVIRQLKDDEIAALVAYIKSLK